MSENFPDEYNPYDNPVLLEQANGDAAYHELLVKEHVAAASLYEDRHNQDKLDHFTTQRDAVLIYEEHLKWKTEQPPRP